MRTWVIAAVALVAVVLAAVAISALNGGLPVEAAAVVRGKVQEFVDERGKTRLPQTYNITMPQDGRISAIDLVEGTPVHQGQVVAHIVTSDLDLAVEAATAAVDRLKASIRENDDVSVETTGLKQSLDYVDSMNHMVEAAKAQVESGHAKLDYTNNNVDRTRKMYQSKTATQDEYEQSQLQQVQAGVEYQQDLLMLRAIEALQAATSLLPTGVQQYIDRKGLTHDVLKMQLEEASVRLKEMERDRNRGELHSPVDGVVLERAVSDERQATAGTVLLKIGRLEDLELEADILSQDVVKVKEGDEVEISGPAIGPTPVHGTVKRIYPAGFTKVSSLGVEQQRVKVIMGFNPDDLARLRKERELGADYRIRVRVFTAQKENALTAPRSALFRGGDGKWLVFAIRDGRAKLQPIETGLMNDEAVEIKSGLHENELVVLAPETGLKDGTRVKPILRDREANSQLPDGD
ncbi:MAG TPA: HlyD family efflux transporter periplasmic adaptor subunit [Pirellulales bacterium]|nr:HlyD family efflux transporter periplasmic adaptor subunit [Pirellulales bacterium]